MTPTTITLPPGAVEWLATGERGLSSETIVQHLTGLPLVQGFGGPARCHPHDPADLIRCRKLLDAVPEFRARLGEMASCGQAWTRLVEHWDELCALVDEEFHTGRCLKAYARMRTLLEAP